MPEEPHKILERDLYSVLIKEHFSESLELMEDLVNYGTNLIPRCYASSEKKIHDIVILVNFLKQAVSLLDSIHILSAKGSTVSCFISLRSLFEISVYLDWIFQQETEKRGSLYFVWDIRQKLHWALSMKEGTPENQDCKLYIRDSLKRVALSAKDPSLLESQISLLEKQLLADECAKINQEFKRRKKGFRDREWYVPGGVNSFREMAKAVKREGEYKVFYSSYSEITHGLAFDEQINLTEGMVVFEPIRNMSGIDEIFRCSLNLILDIYRKVLTHYRYGEIENFNRKYVAEWRARYLTVKSVEYKNGTYTIKSNDLSQLTAHKIKK